PAANLARLLAAGRCPALSRLKATLLFPAQATDTPVCRCVRRRSACLFKGMARPKGFEPLTPRFVVWCSIQLSYGRVLPSGKAGEPVTAIREGLTALEVM